MSRRSMATPVVLVVLAVGAAAYAYLVDRGMVSDAERAARRGDVFPSFRIDEVTRIELDHGPDVLVLERGGRTADEGPTWTMTSPRRTKPDPSAVDALLRELELAKSLREVQGGASLGFDGPRARGRLEVGPLEYRFVLGADAPRPEGAAYMRVEGEGDFVVGRSLKVQLLRGSDSYRDHVLVSVGVSDVARLDVDAGEGRSFTLDRGGAGFRLGGKGVRASRVAVDHLFGALADARVTTFLPDDALEPKDSRIRVRLTPTDPTRRAVELLFGGPCPGHPDEVVVRMPEPSEGADAHLATRMPEPSECACVAGSLIRALSPEPDSLADTSALFAHADEIEQIRLEALGGGAKVEIVRKGRGWHERLPDDRDLDPDESDSANGLALAIANAKSLGLPRTEGGEPQLGHIRATVTPVGGRTPEVVELGSPQPDGVSLARRTDDGAVLLLSRDAARHFAPHPVALRSRTLWHPAFDAGDVVAIDSGCGAVPERLELRGGTWTMRSPRGFAADPSSIADLARAFAQSKVDAWLSERDDGGFGFDQRSSCTVTVTLNGSPSDAPSRRVSLVFGAEGEGGVYAHTLDVQDVFVAPKVLRDLASRPDIDRSRVRLDPAELATVTLVRGAERLQLDRVADRLVRPAREEAGNDDKLGAALAAFSAESAVHVGPPARDEGMDNPLLEIDATAFFDAGPREARIAIGAATRLGAADVYFVRAAGVDATFAVPRRAVQAIIDAW